MLHNLKKRNSQKGFTIIEVMIVLAIAGLIMLVVFLAVPALQRSSRNTQRKNDTAAIASAFANFVDNNGGSLPKTLGKDADTTTLDLCGGGGAATGGSTACTGNLETAKLGFYTPANINIKAGASGDTQTNADKVTIDTGYACNATNTATGSTASSRSAAILYAVESASGTNTQCVEQ